MYKKTLAIYSTVVTACTSKLNFPYFYILFKEKPNFFPFRSSLAFRTLRHAHCNAICVSPNKTPACKTRLLIQQHFAEASDVGTLSDPEGVAV